ncbi:YqhA family protein [Falsiroseomonas sp. E2-1-a4]|uniref:YqhA family protein n=1 Tax=Falsiroseomonas sp. E2-1-a4 TaxID=3239299 RepID=UPI003F323AD0
MQLLIDRIMLASRHVLVVFFLGLGVALAIYALGFLAKLWKFAGNALAGSDNRQLLDLLHLLDAALVASLVVTVMISSYDSLVSRLDKHEDGAGVSWVSGFDPGNLKIKLASALIAISSIHLLQIFMEVSNYDDRAIMWGLAIHGMFVAGAVALGVLDRLTKK